MLVDSVDHTVPTNVQNNYKKDAIHSLLNQIIPRKHNEQGNCVYRVVTFVSVISQFLDFQCHGNAMETKKATGISQTTEQISTENQFLNLLYNSSLELFLQAENGLYLDHVPLLRVSSAI